MRRWRHRALRCKSRKRDKQPTSARDTAPGIPLRYADRTYTQPHYDDRPDYYRPYPYVLPVPFFLGFGFRP
jgi:hypothetical protein